jgi:glycosyltransferase involved in cell wall biosynthesis
MSLMLKKRIIICVTNDLSADQRVDRVAQTLTDEGLDVLLIGRLLPKSLQLVQRKYQTHRMKIPFRKGFKFYATFNIWLFFFLLFKKCDYILANDLDTLPASFVVAKLKRKIIFFDSHEYFPEVPELVNNKFVRNFWLLIEKIIIPNLKYCYTVCKSIADIYSEKYGVQFSVIRNLPIKKGKVINSERIDSKDKKIILYQGWLNEGRGLELMLEAMKLLDNVEFLIAGDGDIADKLHKIVAELGLINKVVFLGKIPFQQLHQYTIKATIGISIEENLGLNYYYALPNKLFDYIQAQLPVLVSDFPEMGSIVKNYNIGLTLKERNTVSLAEQLKIMLFDDDLQKVWKENLKKASNELCWENEKEVLINVFKKAKVL